MMIKVLIVDDEERIRKGLETIIDWSACGCRVCGTANSGRSGLDAAIRLKPDLVIADIRMPGIDGLEMIELAQNEGVFCKYIILSGADDFAYAQRAIELKVAAYLLKPVDKAQLAEKIKQLWADEPAVHAAPKPEDIKDKVLAYIARHYDRPLLLNELANEFHYSAAYFGRIFKKWMNESVHDYVERVRIEKAKTLLKAGNKVYVVCKMIGYNNVDYFTDRFKAITDMTPTEYRESS